MLTFPQLGDVVVSKPTQTNAGVAAYDTAKYHGGEELRFLGHLYRPSQNLRNRVAEMESDPSLAYNKMFAEYVSATTQEAAEDPKWIPIDELQDGLYDAHDSRKKIERTSRRGPKGPHIHHGLIASGSLVMKGVGALRDRLLNRIQEDVYCFETEAAGLLKIENFPCLVVRGISGYCDSHKNDDWHQYASITAACYCKLLLSSFKPENPTITTGTLPGHTSARSCANPRAVFPWKKTQSQSHGTCI